MRNLTLNRFLIIGKANAGKTLFMLNFAEYMGYKSLNIRFKNPNNEISKKNSTGFFKNTIVDDTPNTTKGLQIIDINIPVLKGKKHAEFIDTTGLSSSISFNQDVRDGMVQTLQLLRENYIILHLIDGAAVAGEKRIDEIDMEIYNYGKRKGNYIILANKCDLKEYTEGLNVMVKGMPGVRVINISALYKIGFDEVKRYASKLI